MYPFPVLLEPAAGDAPLIDSLLRSEQCFESVEGQAETVVMLRGGVALRFSCPMTAAIASSVSWRLGAIQLEERGREGKGSISTQITS